MPEPAKVWRVTVFYNPVAADNFTKAWSTKVLAVDKAGAVLAGWTECPDHIRGSAILQPIATLESTNNDLGERR